METRAELLTDLIGQFHNHDTPIEAFEQAIRPNIEYYRWATEPQFHLAPLSIERARLPKGKVYDQVQEDAFIKLGYNAQGQIIFEERTSSSSSGAYQKFVEYRSNTTWSFLFKKSQLEVLAYLTIKDNHPYQFVSYSPGVVNTAEHYFYRGDRLQEIQTLNNYEAFKLAPQHPVYTIEYDRLGEINLILRVDQPSDFFPNGQRLSVYKKSKYSLKTLTDIFQSEMSNAIRNHLEKHKPEDGDCLALILHNSFNGENWLPFQIYTMQAQLTLEEGTMIETYLDFTQLSNSTTSNSRLREVSNLLMQELELKEKYEMPLKLLKKLGKEVAAELAANDDGTKLKVLALDLPDDFYEEAFSVLKRVYSSRECKSFLQK